MPLPPELVTFFMAMIPGWELSVSIPFAVGVLKLPIWSAYLFSVAGLFALSCVLYFALDPITKFLRRNLKFMDRFCEWLFARTRARHSKRLEDLGLLALFLFVMVPLPLPGSGAWTGTLIAYLFGIRASHALPVIGLGILTAGLIVTFGTDLVTSLS